MPNGNPDFDAEKLDKWFEPIASVIEDFAKRRNLLIDKYYHDSPSWCLRFEHPKGGDAYIALLRDFAGQLLISSAWNFSCFEEFTMSSHCRDGEIIERAPGRVAKTLEREFLAVTDLELGNWTSISGGYEDVWGEYSKEEWLSMKSNLPDPNPE